MNFDTRNIIDLVKLDETVTKDFISMIKEEQLFSEKIEQYDYDVFVDSIVLLLKDRLKFFIKNNLKKIGLPILKGRVNIDNVDFKLFVNEIQK